MRDPLAYEARLMTNALSNELAKNEPLSLDPAATELLGSLLNDPWALKEMGEGAPKAVEAMWMLGVRTGRTIEVLRHVADFRAASRELADTVLPAAGPRVAQAMLQQKPRLLEDIEGLQDVQEREHAEWAFWMLAGYDPANEANAGISTVGNDPKAALGALKVLSYAEYLPATVVSQLRSYRDNAITMQHGRELEGLEREQEMAEARTRVLLGSFLARHTKDAADVQFALGAFADYRRLARRDVAAETGVAGVIDSLQLAELLDELQLSDYPPTRDAAASFWRTTTADASAIKINDVLPRQYMPLVQHVQRTLNTARSSGKEAEAALLSALCTRLERDLTGVRAFYELMVEQYRDQSDSDVVPALAVTPPVATLLRANAALRMLQTPETSAFSATTAEAVMHDLQTNGFSVQAVHDAFKLVASELDGAAKERLLARFNVAIGIALLNLSDDDPLKQSNALIWWHNHSDELSVLARFPSGSDFLADLTRKHIRLASIQISRSDEWLHKQPAQDHIVIAWLSAVDAALRANKYYLGRASSNSTQLLGASLTFYEAAKKFILGLNVRDDKTKPELEGYINSFRVLLGEAQRAQRVNRARTLGGVSLFGFTEGEPPLIELLRHYLRQSSLGDI